VRQVLFAAVLGVSAAAAASAPREEPLLLGHICGDPAPAPIAGPHKLVMLPHMGDDHMAADTRSAEAQRWFDYGLTLGRSFEHADSVLAFGKAASIDPKCSLCVWGQAWAAGGNINFGAGAEQTKTNLALAKKAQALAGPTASPRIRRLEAALVDRYAGADEAAGDKAWARDMEAMHVADPNDVEIAVFDAEAWLIVERDGDESAPKKAVAAIQALVPKHPDNTGLVHFYIHATEETGQAQLAEPYVARMSALASGASHMVHMPSHTYFRVGRYEDAALSNVAALKVDRAYAEKTDFPTPLGNLIYHFHDLQFGLGGALMSGDGKAALELVRQFNEDFPAPANYPSRVSGAAAQTYAALGRFAPPDQVMAAPDTVSANPFLEAMRHYARGEVELRLGRPAEARTEAALVAIPDKTAPGAKPSMSMVQTRIARLTLQGDADLMDHHAEAAAKAFTEAADLQETQFADDVDPPRWWFPVRRSLAAALLAQGDAKGAEREASRTLKSWPHDPATLYVKSKAEAALHEPSASRDMAEAKARWHGDPQRLGAVG
jgi:tetratricopeptide (TPR) repeat protein